MQSPACVTSRAHQANLLRRARQLLHPRRTGGPSTERESTASGLQPPGALCPTGTKTTDPDLLRPLLLCCAGSQTSSQPYQSQLPHQGGRLPASSLCRAELGPDGLPRAGGHWGVPPSRAGDWVQHQLRDWGRAGACHRPDQPYRREAGVLCMGGGHGGPAVHFVSPGQQDVQHGLWACGMRGGWRSSSAGQQCSQASSMSNGAEQCGI